ncbi:MAG: hypothetical protein ACRC46_13355 [Thermoguttaceae bacterium]
MDSVAPTVVVGFGDLFSDLSAALLPLLLAAFSVCVGVMVVFMVWRVVRCAASDSVSSSVTSSGDSFVEDDYDDKLSAYLERSAFLSDTPEMKFKNAKATVNNLINGGHYSDAQALAREHGIDYLAELDDVRDGFRGIRDSGDDLWTEAAGAP